MKSLLSRLPVTLLIASLTILHFAGCSGQHVVPPVTLQSIAVTPASPSIFAGATQQFKATGTYSDASTKDITTTVTWASGTMATATIIAGPGATGGLATAVAAGTSAITAALGGVTSPPDTLTVKAVTLVSIQVTPANPTLTLGTTQQFTATGTYTDNSMKDITTQVTWASLTPATATITPGPGAGGGLATPVAGGTTVITATLAPGTPGQTTLTVAAVTLASIKVTPVNPTVAVGLTQQFTATGTYSDNSTKDITSQVTWASGTPGTATITSPGGLATAVAAGTSAITAALGAVTSPPTTLTVTAATLVSIAVTPVNPFIAVGTVINFTATGTYSDTTTKPLAGVVTWSSGTPATASIDPASGLAQGLAVGTSTIKATAGSVNGTTLLTVQVAASRFAYTGNPNVGSGTISIFAVNPANGTFSNRGYVEDFDGPLQVIPDLSGKYAYAIEGDSAKDIIKIFDIDPVSGNLTPSAITAVSNSSEVGSEGVIDPSGRFLYVVNNLGNNVSAYAIDPTTGGLTPLTGSPYLVGTSPYSIVTDRTGKFAYVTNSGDNTVSGFTINADGTLTPLLPKATFNTGVFPAYPAISPSNVLYVPNNTDNTVSAFTINADGSLTPVPGSPFADVPLTLAGPATAAVDPSGKYLYVTNNSGATLSGFAIGAGGALGATTLPGSPYSTGASPYGLTVDAGGALVAVTNNGSNTVTNDGSDTVSLFSLNPATGALTPTGAMETGAIPQFTNLSLATSAPIIAPAAAFAANSASNNVSAFIVTPGTGALTAATPPTVTGVAGNGLAATDLAGSFFFTAGPTAPGNLAGFSVNQGTAVLTGLTGSPYSFSPAAVSSTVLADPSERFVYVAGTGVAGSILGYDATTTPGALTPISGSPFTDASFANLNALAMDPQGHFLFALANGLVEPVTISNLTGQLVVTPGTSTVAAGTWTAGAVDSSGQFLLALDSVAKTIQAFSITPASGSSPATDGKLTAVATGPVSVGGTLPSSVAIDPLDRFVFVTDATANTITVFSFNVTTGVVAMIGAPVSVPSGAGQAAVDATGTYLYVALQGTPGSVAAYKIGSTGTLTAVAGSPFTAGNGTLGVAISNSIK